MKQQPNKKLDTTKDTASKLDNNRLVTAKINHLSLKDISFWKKIITLATPFLIIWSSLLITYGAICMHTNWQGQDEFYRFIFFLQNPIVLTLNILAFITAVIHTFIYFVRLAIKLNQSLFVSQKMALIMAVLFLLVTLVFSILFILWMIKA